MKKSIISLFVFLMLPVQAWAFSDTPHVSVTGTGFIETAPDEMFWSLSVENTGQEIKALSARQNEVVSGVIAFLKKAKIPENEIQTTRPRIGERWGHQNGVRFRDGFATSSAITFKLTDFSRYPYLWEKLTGFKGMNIRDVAYGYSKKKEARDKARTLALNNARNKARQMAETLECRIGSPLVIEAFDDGGGMMRKNVMMAAEADMGGRGRQSFAPGRIKIEAKVRTVFSLRCE